MVDIQVKISQPLSKDSIRSINSKITEPLTKDTIYLLNRQQTVTRNRGHIENRRDPPCQVPAYQTPSYRTTAQVQSNIQNRVTADRPVTLPVPQLLKPVRKGQKIQLADNNRNLSDIKVCFGWNINDARCDVDASAFLTDGTGRVPGDDWFVFYGQRSSPDQSVTLSGDSTENDRQVFRINLEKVQENVKKIIFVLTINEAFENGLNFSMLLNVYLRILNSTGQELVSFKLEEYFPDVTSMTIGELYLYNGKWKFNPVGNGVHQDLSGQCAVYGVRVS